MMTPNEYQQRAARTECIQLNALMRINSLPHQAVETDNSKNAMTPLVPTRLLHAAVGMSNELGEITSTLQRWLFYGRPFTWSELRAKIKDECGDLLWHVAQALTACDITLQEVMDANIAKLRVRYPDAYTDLRAAEEARDRAAEAAVQQRREG